MFVHPEFQLSQFHQRESELVAEADRYRLLASTRRGRTGARGGSRGGARGRPNGTLTV